MKYWTTKQSPCVALLVLSLVLVASYFIPVTRADTTVTWDNESLMPKERLEVFEKVWKEINDNFYDPSFKGVNWQEVHNRYLPLVEAVQTDSEFYTLISKMAGELRDSHTRILSPAVLTNLQAQKRPGPGFVVEEIEGKPVITSVADDSEAARAGIEPGMIVLSVDGQPAAEKIAEVRKTIAPSSSKRLDDTRTFATSFGAPVGKTLKFSLQRVDGSTFEASVTSQLLSAAPKLTSRLLPSGQAYIAFNQFTPELTKEFNDALRNFQNAPGLIIDLRNNSGGSSQALYPLATSFYNAKTLFLRDTNRTGREMHDAPPMEIFIGERGKQLYSGLVAILVGPRSGSTAELFAAALQDTKRAIVIGSQSCGCAVGINKQRRLTGGGVLEIAEILWLTPSARKIEGDGVVPDQVVVSKITDLQQKRDPVLAAAEKVLQDLSNSSTTKNPKVH
jgi:carboxyl-terminal processing protease